MGLEMFQRNPSEHFCKHPQHVSSHLHLNLSFVCACGVKIYGNRFVFKLQLIAFLFPIIEPMFMLTVFDPVQQKLLGNLTWKCSSVRKKEM